MKFLKRIFDHEYKELEKFKKIAKEPGKIRAPAFMGKTIPRFHGGIVRGHAYPLISRYSSYVHCLSQTPSSLISMIRFAMVWVNSWS